MEASPRSPRSPRAGSGAKSPRSGAGHSSPPASPRAAGNLPLADMRQNKQAVYKADKSATKKLRYAVFSGDIKAAKKLLRKGGDLEGEDADCYTPVLIAARWNRIDMAQVSKRTPLFVPGRGMSR